MKNSKIIFSLGNNQELAKKLAGNSKIKLGRVIVSNFADGEVAIKLEDDCRGKKVFLVQSTHQPDSSFTKLILASDAARRASAEEIVAVIPYFGYSRQERLSEPGTSISTKVFATMLEAAGIDRVVVVDLHSKAIEGFFTNTIVDHVNSIPMFTSFLKKEFSKEIANDNIRIVAPDTGAANNARNFSMNLLGHSELAIVSKSRSKANHISSMQLVGEVKDKIAIIVDDMADTCGTLVKAAELLKDSGASKVFAVVTHAIFSGDAVTRLDNSCLEKVYISNTIEKENLPSKIEVVNVVNLIVELIKKI
jgi:ribose-phosphate pyrophosphokinase